MVRKLRAISPDDEHRRAIANRIPPGSSRSVLFSQSEIAQGRLQALSDDPAVTEADLVHAGEAIGTDAVSNTIDQKYANPRQRQKTFPCHFGHELRRNHRERRKRVALRVNENRPQ
jgi:hypothetical protein